ncbi:glycine cleavage system transcriptional repressor [Budvicia aquatica]|uniref:Glycine cleavage system transcriptional repressor n=1 Tax=Budvicia aquatica TaxID=82979 RepID=A0A2C6DT53_9GAMM|nr:glycine cleavage system transcriptional repressor [Budvicia aquatica]MBP9642772.1 glycine cleavage system transcriptional repressor [Budvicia sp.]PHI31873.1 glycine cleavage system transcriptional repressor [Budvicia aquatica]GKX51235.1 glycine cleavage system transcriptional repressor [Budvicia aquatica]VFS52888.1 Gcv operon repressor [Budvicia aquatica]
MPQQSEYYLVITALGTDRPGIVNTITRHVSSCGCNIEDSRLALLGEEFTFIMLLSGGWSAMMLLESTLPQKGVELDLLIVMKRTTQHERPPMPVTMWVKVEVKDSPHLIERFTNLFDAEETSIAELTSKTSICEITKDPTLYIEMTLHSALTGSQKIVEQDFHCLCTELNAQGSITIVINPQHEEKDGN